MPPVGCLQSVWTLMLIWPFINYFLSHLQWSRTYLQILGKCIKFCYQFISNQLIEFTEIRFSISVAFAEMCQDIYDSVLPLHLLSKLFGFALFTIDRKTFKVVFKKLDVLLMVFNAIVAILLSCVYWNYDFHIEVYRSGIMKSIFPLVALCNYGIFSCAMFWSFCQRRKLGKLMKLIHDVDDDFDMLGVKFNYRKQRNLIFKLIFGINFMNLALCFAFVSFQKFKFKNIDVNSCILTSWGFMANFVVVNQFVTAICAVRQRIMVSNNVIR